MNQAVVVLVGRPNVGKSTLFNRLTKTQDALVADYAGLTRDRQYGQVSYQDKHFIIVDTGGLGVDDHNVDLLMIQQSQKALAEANVILFLVDAKAGLTPADEAIAVELRKTGKTLILVVNKIDGHQAETACAEFQSLGFKHLVPISASHGRGIDSLLAGVTRDFTEVKPEDDQLQGIRVAFIGRPNVGKSTLVNRILGEERVLVYDLPGTTRDSIYIPFSRHEQSYVLIDTAGVRKKSRIEEKIEKFSIIKTLQAIQAANVCLVLIDGQEGITDQDLHLLGFCLEAGRGIVIVVNKWDGLDADHKESIRSMLDRRLRFLDFVKIKFISALHGTGVGELFTDINQAYTSSTQKLSTPQLTRILQALVLEHNPPLVQGRRIKLRYAHAGGHNPPLIIIHGNQLSALPESYKRYLIHGFIQHLNLVGTPLKIEFKTGNNPFKGKKNKLNERQLKKRKRLIRFAKRS